METEENGSQHSAEEGLSVRNTTIRRIKKGRTGRNRRLHLHVRAARDHLNQEETWMEKIRKWQDEDEDLCIIKSWMERPPWKEIAMRSKELKSLLARWRHIPKEEGLLWYLWELEKRPPTWKMIIPPGGRSEILQEHHDSKMAGLWEWTERMIA